MRVSGHLSVARDGNSPQWWSQSVVSTSEVVQPGRGDPVRQVPLACAVTACHGARARGWAWSWLAACEGTGFVDQAGPPGRVAVADDSFAEGPARGSERLVPAAMSSWRRWRG